MENQQAIMLAKGADPAGQRTIGPYQMLLC